MKKVLVVMLSLVSLSAHAGVKAEYLAHHADFVISAIGAGPGETVYYSCDSVEAATTELLTKMGAKNISVDCSGGLDYPLPAMDASVSADFESLTPVTGDAPTAIEASFSGVTLAGADNCYLINSILSGVSADFTTARLSSSSCTQSNDSYSISLSVLK